MQLHSNRYEEMYIKVFMGFFVVGLCFSASKQIIIIGSVFGIVGLAVLGRLCYLCRK